jgi:hypothetical protein
MGLRLSKDFEPGLKSVDLGSLPVDAALQPGSGDVVASAA